MKPKILRLTFITSLTSGLEYYDFVIYGLLANYLSKAFLPDTNPITNIIQIFGIFALGYLTRPIGGIIFGNLGDRYGRRKVFLVSLFLMAISTFAIGLLPSYHHFGLASAFLLVLARALQGLAFGAELPGTITFLSEHATNTNRGLYCGLALSSVSLGAALGAGIIYLLGQVLNAEQMQSYGWRLPFILGGTLAIVSYFIRKKLIETPVFLEYLANKKITPAQKAPFAISILLKNHLKKIILGISLCLLSACLIIFGITMPTYLQHFYGYSAQTVYFYTCCGFIWSALILPGFGWLGDRQGRSRQLFWTALIIAVGAYSLFEILNLHHWLALAVFIIIYNMLVASLAVCYFPLLAELFPTPIRFTGVAVCYNLVYLIASFTPSILTKIAFAAGSAKYTYLFFSLLAFTTIIGSIFASKKISLDLIRAN